MKSLERHYFPGGNTSQGFYSYFSYIISQKEAKRIFCLKGGPGTGKSSLMKKVGEHFKEKGYTIEFHHCSSDNNSLDGLVIKELGVAILDGTAPHIVDPKNPGAVDEIINLGQCWDEEGIQKCKEQILETNKSISETFQRAYKYILAAKTIRDDWSELNSSALNLNKINLLKEDLKNRILKSTPNTIGIDRHLFSTGFTPNGIVTYINNLLEGYENIYVLNGTPGTGKNEILKYIANEAIRRGHYVEILHTPLNPKNIEHILIPNLNTAIVTSNEINGTSFEGQQIYMDNYLSYETLNKNNSKIIESKEDFYYLLNKGLTIISQAKKLHDALEKYYVPNMNFSKNDEVYNMCVEKICKYQ